MSTLQEMAARALDRDPAQPLIEYQKAWLTIGQMKAVGDRVNALLDASGADPRAPVAVAPRNRPGMLAAILGLVARGRHIRMIHVYQSPAGLARDIERLKPAAVVAMAEDFGDEVTATLKARGVAGVALAGMEPAAVAGCERSSAECDPPPPTPQIDLLTSGTTGKPKQFPLTYEFLARDMVANNTIQEDRSFDPLTLPPAYLYFPFGNFSGLYATLTPMVQGQRGFLTDRYTMAECHDFLLRFRPSWLGCPPAGVQMILDANIPAEDLASVKCIRTGSAPVPLASHKAFEEKYGIPILIAYGATEFGGPVTLMTPELYEKWGKAKLGSVGRPWMGARLRVIDPQTGAELPPGEEGLLELVSPRMGEHWIRTSDLGVIDEDGFLWHRGRADGAIMRGGFKVLPEVIEEALAKHPAVAAAVATGVADHRLGQVPAVGVQLKPGAPAPSREELEKHLRQLIESTHIPVHWRFVEALPYTQMMKPDRLALRTLFETEAAT
jgi:acyl-coenzyme A synthetase/AMP-(fatty) acid ligase